MADPGTTEDLLAQNYAAYESIESGGEEEEEEVEEVELEASNVKCVLLDIEGTICPISFVKDTLFPYALRALPSVLATKWTDPDFAPYLIAFPEQHRSSPQDLQTYIEQLTAEDRKDACLKNLQGYLWETGYKTGAYATPLFLDVAPRLKQWRDAGLRLAIYSSGSVFAQKLLFGHVRVGDDMVGTAEVEEGLSAGRKRRKGVDGGEGDPTEVKGEEPPAKKVAIDANEGEGGSRTAEVAVNSSEALQSSSEGTEDLQYLISAWFDTTNAGPKKEKESYLKIAEELELSPEEILFLTDSVEEYDASTEAGLKAGLMMRPGNPRLKKSEDVNRFNMMWTLQNAQPLKQVPKKKEDDSEEQTS